MRHAGFLVMFAGSAAIAAASIFGKAADAEPALWLALCFAGAFTFVRTREHPVRYAFPATALGAFAAPALQAALFPTLLAHHPELKAQLATIPAGMSPRLFVLVMGPVVALAYAGVTTLVTLAIRRMTRDRSSS